MRVVLDTNVFISSFFGGKPREIIDLWKSGDITLCLSKPIIEEYVKVLQRLGLQTEPELKELLSLFSHGFHIVFAATTPDLHIVEKDPDDDKFIECAVALNAAAVVSGDRAVIGIGEYMGIVILTPAEFLTRFQAAQRIGSRAESLD
jgi:uncharacterized protein